MVPEYFKLFKVADVNNISGTTTLIENWKFCCQSTIESVKVARDKRAGNDLYFAKLEQSSKLNRKCKADVNLKFF